MSTKESSRISITPLKPTAKGTPFAVQAVGQLIIERSYAPSFAACRWLVEQGFSGRAEVWSGQEKHPRMTIDSIERAAKLTVSESERHGPRVVRFVPFEGAAMHRVNASQQKAKDETVYV